MLKSYVIVGRWANIPLRLLIVLIGILIGLTSISILYSFEVLEGILLFVFFFISCYMIDSHLNINARKSQKISSAINMFSRNTFMGILTIHIVITIALASHLSFILNRYQILAFTVIGLMVVTIGSIIAILQLKTSLSSNLPSNSTDSNSISNMNALTTSIGMVLLPMTSAYFITNASIGLFQILVIIGITTVFGGITLFEQLNERMHPNKDGVTEKNSVEWEAVQVAKELGLGKSSVKYIGVELHNIRNEPEFVSTPNNQRILFLPHCLRVAEKCKGKYTDEGLLCRHCQKECRVHLITTEAEKLGYKCFVVPGGAMVFNIAKKYKPKGVVAVACFNELKEGAARSSGDYKVPFQLIPLLKDGCVNTDVDVETVKNILNKNNLKSAS